MQFGGGAILGLAMLLTIAILVLIAIFWVRVKKQTSTSDSSSSAAPSSAGLFSTGPTGCFILDRNTDSYVFQLRMDENPMHTSSDSSSSSSSSPCATPLNCPRGTLTIKKPLFVEELIMTVGVATGTYITDIYAQAVPACKKQCKAKCSDFGQTGCSVDLNVGYTHFAFPCTGGSNQQTVSLPLPTGTKDYAFLSVVANVADTCTAAPQLVDQLTIDGETVPHLHKGCPKTPYVQGCAQPQPRYTKIAIPYCCRNPR